MRIDFRSLVPGPPSPGPGPQWAEEGWGLMHIFNARPELGEARG